MFDLRENLRRLTDELADIGDDVAKRAGPLSKEWVDRARPYGRDLLERARPYGEDLIKRARPYADSLSNRAGDLVRRARHETATVVAPEPRSFLDGGPGKLAAAAGLGVLAGLLFTTARKAAVQGSDALAGDWLEVVKLEHRQIEGLLDSLVATDNRAKIRRNLLLARLGHALGKLSVQKETVIYPALKDAIGESEALRLYAASAKVKMLLHALGEIAKDDPLWIERARAFQAFVVGSQNDEEREVYPAYHGRMSPQQNRRLTLQVHAVGIRRA